MVQYFYFIFLQYRKENKGIHFEIAISRVGLCKIAENKSSVISFI